MPPLGLPEWKMLPPFWYTRVPYRSNPSLPRSCHPTRRASSTQALRHVTTEPDLSLASYVRELQAISAGHTSKPVLRFGWSTGNELNVETKLCSCPGSTFPQGPVFKVLVSGFRLLVRFLMG